MCEKILQTFYLYGGIFAAGFVIYNVVRPRFEQLYNPRDTFTEANLQCELSGRKYRGLRWVPAVLRITYDDLLEQVRHACM
jgi:hypothetical protein